MGAIHAIEIVDRKLWYITIFGLVAELGIFFPESH
jgi:hypothetical protein